MRSWIGEVWNRIKFPAVIGAIVVIVWVMGRERALTSRTERGLTIPTDASQAADWVNSELESR